MNISQKKKLALAIVTLAIIICAILFAYLISIKGNRKIKENNEVVKELLIDEKNAIMDKIKTYKLMALSYDNEEVKFDNNVSNSMLYLLLHYMISQDETNFNNHFTNAEKWKISKNDADLYFKNLYNINPLDYTDYICPNDNIALLKYDQNNKEFVYNDEHPGHGDRITDFIDYYIVDAYKQGDMYTLSLLFLYGDQGEGYYVNNEELAIDFADDSYVEPEDYDNAVKNYFQSSHSSFKNTKKYIYKFKKVKDNYYLKEFKIK